MRESFFNTTSLKRGEGERREKKKREREGGREGEKERERGRERGQKYSAAKMWLVYTVYVVLAGFYMYM